MPRRVAAAAATAGLVLGWRGAPASVYYTASCGGFGERPSNVWPGAPDPPFLPSQRDSACDREPPWSVEIPARDLQRALSGAGFRGSSLRDVRVRVRSESGRALSLDLLGLTPDQVSGQTLRMIVGRALGWRLLKSTSFDVRRTSQGYRFSGRGFGHGVGFCVIGATRRAAAGESRAALLARYFPGVEVVPATADLLRAPVLPSTDPTVPLGSGEALTEDLPASRAIGSAPLPPAPSGLEPSPRPPAPASDAPATPAAAIPARRGLTITLPAADERDRAFLAALVERTVAAAAARVARPIPRVVEVVFHPTVEGFTAATGEPAWSAAFTAGVRIDLQPLAALRQRGELEAVVAHEAAHVVTGPALAGRARWVQEGAAMFASGELTASEIAAARRAGGPALCPSDAELRGAASAAASRDGAARARQCYARALAANARWDEVR